MSKKIIDYSKISTNDCFIIENLSKVLISPLIKEHEVYLKNCKNSVSRFLEKDRYVEFLKKGFVYTGSINNNDERVIFNTVMNEYIKNNSKEYFELGKSLFKYADAGIENIAKQFYEEKEYTFKSKIIEILRLNKSSIKKFNTDISNNPLQAIKIQLSNDKYYLLKVVKTKGKKQKVHYRIRVTEI